MEIPKKLLDETVKIRKIKPNPKIERLYRMGIPDEHLDGTENVSKARTEPKN